MFKKIPLISIVAIILLIFNLLGLIGCSSRHAILVTLIDTSSKGIAEYIYIGGSVNNPGFYPLKNIDNIETLVKAAGGLVNGKECRQIQLIINDEDDGAQKININRAAAWLLEALPGIGNTRANAIIKYRIDNGGFKNINEILKVEGIGQDTFENIKDLITVDD
jgi:competence protein ComEA